MCEFKTLKNKIFFAEAILLVKTIGNATLLAYDKSCILATDPWMGEEDDAYFGSWGLNHHIPGDIRRDIFSSKYIWFSHGHPDHLNPNSIKKFKGNKILLPDHVGGRIKDGLNEQGFDVEIIQDREWFKLSSNVRIFCITTVKQDAILLVDVNGYLFVNLNDAGTVGCHRLIKKICSYYQNTYLLALPEYGDANMINFFDESGMFIGPKSATAKDVGNNLSLIAKSLKINNIIPFSDFHIYQRKDSIWANKYGNSTDTYQSKYFNDDINFIPPFAIIDCITGGISHTDVMYTSSEAIDPEVFGDNWSEELNNSDIKLINNYFQRKEKVRQFISFINFRVGGKDNFIRLHGPKDKGITFEVPRGSLMKSIRHEIFDDLLIGNFMRTTLHNMESLYENDFGSYVAKYADNGRAETISELELYFKEYNKRVGMERFYEAFIDNIGYLGRKLLSQNRGSILFSSAKKIYHSIKY